MTNDDSVLYFPSIEFASDEWVKTASLVWEHIYRIVPSAYQPKDSPTVLEAIDAGIVRNLSVTADDLSRAADDFDDFLSSQSWLPAGLQGGDGPTVRLFEDKVDARILPQLRELARLVNHDRTLELPARLADGYMLYLSSTVARRRGLAKATDSADIYSVMTYYDTDGNVSEWPGDNDAADYTAAVITPTVLPAGVEFLPIEQIVKTRDATREARERFRSILLSIGEELVQVSDSAYRRERLETFASDLERASAHLGSQLRETFSELKQRLLSFSLPLGLSAFGALATFNGPFSLTTLGGSLALTATAALADARQAAKQRKAWSARDASYFLDLRKLGSKPMDCVPRFDRLLEEFIND